jgi:hypothetical protein
MIFDQTILNIEDAGTLMLLRHRLCKSTISAWSCLLIPNLVTYLEGGKQAV